MIISRLIILSLFSLILCACSPAFNWREVHGSDVPFTVLFPGKASSASRDLQLAGMPLNMVMTAAEAGDASFAVGAVKLKDASQSARVAEAMRTGLLNNIGAADTVAGKDGVLRASGKDRNGQAIHLAARFVTNGPLVYQVVIIGGEKAMQQEVVDTFMTSFKPE